VALLDDTIEQSGFANVWSADDCYKTHSMGKATAYTLLMSS
jgi:hypothetical protein